MSEGAQRIREAVAREAAEGEAEPGEEEQAEEEPKPEPEPEPEEPQAEAEGEEPQPTPIGAENSEQVAELEKAQAAYFKRVEKTLSPQPLPPLCPACQGTGLDFSGGAGEPEYKPSPDRERCEDCGGLGKVLSGSLVLNEEVLPCPGCQGTGHRVKLAVPVLPPAEVPAAETEQPRPAWMGTGR
jgi:hypothetical protein